MNDANAMTDEPECTCGVGHGLLATASIPNCPVHGRGYTQQTRMRDEDIVVAALEAWKGGMHMDRDRAMALADQCRREGGLQV